MTGSAPQPAAPPLEVAAPGRWHGADVPVGLALLLVSVAATLGLTRLVTPSGGVDLLGPVLAAVVVGHAVVAVGHRLGWRTAASLCGAVVAVVAVVIWSALPGTTWWGVPTAATVQALFHGLHEGMVEAAATSSPVRLGNGMVILVSLAAGSVAIVGRWLWTVLGRTDGQGRPVLPVLVPSFAVFCYTSVLSADRARASAAIAYVVTALAFLLLATRRHRRRGQRSAGGWAGAAALAAVTVAGALLTLEVPAVADVTLSAFVGHPGAPTAIGPVTSLDLEVDVAAVRGSGSQEVMFRATVDEPTYWEVTILADDDHGTWLPGPVAARASGQPSHAAPRTPPSLPQPPVRTVVRGEVRLVDLRTALLPVPSTAGSVAAASGSVVRVTTGVGARVLRGAPAKGYRYRFAVAAPTTTVPGLHSAPGSSNSTWASLVVPGVGPYLQLPDEPRAVVRLAQRLVPPGATPAATAYAIERYLTSGRFTYTLHPPPPGRHPLSQFLFGSRQGFCQQFATAFAVLARLDHLPTRLVVGFTAGTPGSSGGSYAVTAADAHVWPQVYFGPNLGWVDFEPTPGYGSGIGPRPGPIAPSGSSPITSPSQGSTPTTTGGSSSLSTPGTPGASRSTGPAASGHVSPAVGDPLPLLVGGGLVVLALGTIAVALERRRRRELGRRSRIGGVLRWPRSRGTTDVDGSTAARFARVSARPHDPAGEGGLDGASMVVAACWLEAERWLGTSGYARLPSETLQEHAQRLELLLEGDPPRAATAYARIVELTERVAYGAGRLSDQEGHEARLLLDTMRSSPLRRRAQPAVPAGQR